MQAYQQNIDSLRNLVLQSENKHSFVMHSKDGSILNDVLEANIIKINNREGETDFQIISLIRFLYVGDRSKESVKHAHTKVENSLCLFPFWPITNHLTKDVDKIVFWSENHIFMMLGSCYLFKQWQLKNRDSSRLQAAVASSGLSSEVEESDSSTSSNTSSPPFLFEEDLETQLLMTYLRAHCSPDFNGVYECNSHVYLPYTLSALMNIYDFSDHAEMKKLALQIINNVVMQLMLCTPVATGVCNLSASLRSFARTRQRNWGHNVNQLVNLMNLNISGDTPSCSAMTDFLLTTTWRPTEAMFAALTEDQDVRMMRVSHSIEKIREIYFAVQPAEEAVPFFWSAGLILHPQFTIDTKHYQKLKKMEKNKHLWPLSYLMGSQLKMITKEWEIFSKGQTYCDAQLNIYKRSAAGLCLTSLELFNCHNSGFQQLPWMANVMRLPVWTQSGGSENIGGFKLTNTHNPACTQRGSMLLVTYLAPGILTGSNITSSLFSYKTKLFWPPSGQFDHSRVVNSKYHNADVIATSASGSVCDIHHATEGMTSDTGDKGLAGIYDSEVHYSASNNSAADTEDTIVDKDRSFSSQYPHSEFEELGGEHTDDEEEVLYQERTRDPSVADNIVAMAAAPSQVKKRSSNPFKSFGKFINKTIGDIETAFAPNSSASASGSASKKALSNTGCNWDMFAEPNTWCVGQKGDCYIGVMCTQPTVMSSTRAKDSEIKVTSEKDDVFYMNNRHCHKHRHSWVVLVSTTAEYATIDDFIAQRCFALQVSEVGGGGGASNRYEPYRIVVEDVTEGKAEYAHDPKSAAGSSEGGDKYVEI